MFMLFALVRFCFVVPGVVAASVNFVAGVDCLRSVGFFSSIRLPFLKRKVCFQIFER